MIVRDSTRRHHNLLCKPISEFDVSNLKRISYSYYEMAEELPITICTGRNMPDMKKLC